MKQPRVSTDASILHNHDMRGWRIHVVFDAHKINNIREEFSSARPPPPGQRTFHIEQPHSSTREVLDCKLAAPSVKYLDDCIQVKSPVLSCVNAIWTHPVFGGKPRANLDSVVAFWPNEPQFLYHEIPLDDCVGYCAGPGRPLVLKIGTQSTFYSQADGAETRDTQLGWFFRSYFDALPDAQRTVELYEVDARNEADWLLKEMNFQIRKHPLTGSHVLQVCRGDTSGSPLPLRDPTPKDELAAYIHANDVPGSTDVNTFTDLAGLLLPLGYAWCDTFSQDHATGVYKATYKFYSDTREPAAAPEPLILHADPLVAAIRAGDTAKQITVSPQVSTALVWALADGGQGKIAPGHFVCDYTPPSQPPIHLSDNSVCQEPTATKTSFDEPARIEAVLTGNTLLSPISTFVVLNMEPNLFFKTELSQGRVKLRFCYIDKKTKQDVEVPADRIKWTVLAGQGKVSQEGIFSPSLLSRYTVIQAEKIDPDDWYWAYIILPIPLMTAEAFVDQWNKA